MAHKTGGLSYDTHTPTCPTLPTQKIFRHNKQKHTSDLRSDAIVQSSPLLHQLAPVSWAVALSTLGDHLQSALGHFDAGFQSLADGVLVGDHQLVGYWIQRYRQQSLIRQVIYWLRKKNPNF